MYLKTFLDALTSFFIIFTEKDFDQQTESKAPVPDSWLKYTTWNIALEVCKGAEGFLELWMGNTYALPYTNTFIFNLN